MVAASNSLVVSVGVMPLTVWMTGFSCSLWLNGFSAVKSSAVAEISVSSRSSFSTSAMTSLPTCSSTFISISCSMAIEPAKILPRTMAPVLIWACPYTMISASTWPWIMISPTTSKPLIWAPFPTMIVPDDLHVPSIVPSMRAF